MILKKMLIRKPLLHFLCSMNEYRYQGFVFYQNKSHQNLYPERYISKYINWGDKNGDKNTMEK